MGSGTDGAPHNCYTTFNRWNDERNVNVNRNDNDWNDNWVFAGVPQFSSLLAVRLNLTLHPDKVSIKTFASGVDFLGWVHFPDHRVLRGATKRRMLRRITETNNDAVIGPYLGLLSHGNARMLEREVRAALASF